MLDNIDYLNWFISFCEALSVNNCAFLCDKSNLEDIR